MFWTGPISILCHNVRSCDDLFFSKIPKNGLWEKLEKNEIKIKIYLLENVVVGWLCPGQEFGTKFGP